MTQVFASDALPTTIAIAVSGGSDSIALCLLAQKWCEKKSVKLVGLTVDHGLRAEAALEAQDVKLWLQKYGIEHHTLKWAGPYPDAGIQQAARHARYDLISEKCRALRVQYVLLGHQLEDQLETLLLRLSKGSGVQGLAAMDLVSERGAISLVRPLLTLARADLRLYLTENNQEWIDDPSNESPIYTRTKLGAVLKQIVTLPGSSMASVALGSKRLQRADRALEKITSDFLSSLVVISPFGYVSFPENFHKNMPEEIGIRFLERIFMYVRGGNGRPVLMSLEKLFTDICNSSIVSAATLAGCQLKKTKNSWIVCREPGRKGLPVLGFESDPSILWDDRFLVVDHRAENESSEGNSFTVQKIGDDGWKILANSEFLDNNLVLPNIVKKNLPAIWLGDKLAAAPLFSYYSGVMGIAKGRFEVVFSPKSDLI
ncbi:MAG: tRNA lysidine(34) synthetase TilS [Sneathiella sp.]|nr:tRNA lysidine(34) synthetase TilS [Sneathiella sp.]